MKKFLTILLSLCILLSCAMFAACSAPSSEPTVSAQEYATAMQFGGDFKFAMTATETGDGYTDTASTEYTINGDKIHIKSVNSEGTNEIYLSKEGSDYFMYLQIGSEWQKNSYNQQMYDYYKAFSATALQAYANLTFEMLTYDGAEKCYKVIQEENGMSGTFKIFFENKKVVKLVTSVVNSHVGETINTEILLTYNVAITLPGEQPADPGTGGEFTLTADNYDELMSVSDYDCTVRGVMTGDMDGVYDFVYNEGIICQKTYDGDDVIDVIYIAQVEDKYYEYNYNESEEEWHAQEIYQTMYESMRTSNDFNVVYSFEDWTYNAQTDRYEAEDKNMGAYMGSYVDAWFKVENGKLVAYGVTNVGTDQNGDPAQVTYSFTVNYTPEVLQLPEIPQE